MFHQSSRIKTTIETLLLCLSLLDIPSHISHIHDRLINRQVRALLRQHFLTHTILGHRHPLIQPSTILTPIPTAMKISSTLHDRSRSNASSAVLTTKPPAIAMGTVAKHSSSKLWMDTEVLGGVRFQMFGII
jgi:hypothetical protein